MEQDRNNAQDDLALAIEAALIGVPIAAGYLFALLALIEAAVRFAGWD